MNSETGNFSVVNYGESNFFIDDLIYIPVGNYHAMYNRPYLVNVSKNAIDTISERMHDTKSGKITSSIVNGVANEIIQPSAVPFQTPIDNNWVSTKKYIFLLKVRTIDPMGVELQSYIQGYTNYDGITSLGNIDLDLVHYINNVIETSIMTINTPLGILRKEKIYKIYNVFFNETNEDIYAQRPIDVFDNINTLNLKNFMSDFNVTVNNISNYINPLDKKTISSSIDNNITTQYLSKILTSGVLDNKEKNIFVDSYQMDSLTGESKINEPSIYDNRFLKYISRLAGFKIVREFFTFRTLMNFDSTIYNRFKLINITKDYVDPVLSQTPEIGDYWHGQDIVTIKAYSLIENSVALAVKYGFSKIFFTASNMINPIGTSEVFITNFNSFINLDEIEFNYLLELFKEKFITDIFLNETNSGVIPMHVEAYIDLLGTSKIHLSFSNFPSNWFTIPTFANSHFSSVITTDKNGLDFASANFSTIIDSLTTNFNQQQSYF